MSAHRVLVVDDSSVIRELARLGLATVGGLDVVTVESGEAALEQAAAAPPDAILLDVDMPGLSGPDTLARLRADAATRAIPVVLVTADHDAADHEQVAGLGVAGLIRKPFDVTTLAGRVTALVGWTA